MTIRVVLALLCAVLWASAAGAQGLQRVPNCGDGQPPPGTSVGTQDMTGRECVSSATGYAFTASGAITRSSNTTTYTQNTGWNGTSPTVFTFANACQSAGGASLIPQISLRSSANPTLKLNGILWLFNVTPGTVIADNATFNIAAADFANLTGGTTAGISFSLTSLQASGAANSGTSLAGTTYYAQCATGSSSLFGMVEVTNLYAPASGEVLTIQLNVVGLR